MFLTCSVLHVAVFGDKHIKTYLLNENNHHWSSAVLLYISLTESMVQSMVLGQSLGNETFSGYNCPLTSGKN